VRMWAGVPFRHNTQPPASAQQAHRSARVSCNLSRSTGQAIANVPTLGADIRIERFPSQALCGSFDPQTPRCISRTISFAVFAEEDTGWATSASGAACDGEAEAAPRRDGHASLFALWRSHLLPRLTPRVQLECPEDCRRGVTWLRGTQSGHRPLPPVGTVLATFEWPSCPPCQTDSSLTGSGPIRLLARQAHGQRRLRRRPGATVPTAFRQVGVVARPKSLLGRSLGP
jgi:hypothetical protein